MFFEIVKLHDLSHPEVDLYIAIEGVVVDVEGQLELSFFLDVGRLKQSQRIGVQLPPDCNDRGAVGQPPTIKQCTAAVWTL